MRVLVATALTDAQFARVQAADANVDITDSAVPLIRRIPEALRPGQVLTPDRSNGAALEELLAPAEVIMASRRMPLDTAKLAPNLKWVQLPLAGIEWFRTTDLWTTPRVTLTNTDIAQPVSEWVLLAMLALGKDARRMLTRQQEHRWERWNLPQLRGKRLGVIGYGGIGTEVARLGQALGMQVMATKRHMRAEERLPDWVLPMGRMEQVLRESDYIVLAVPATPETAGLIGARELALMKATAYLINVARGDVIDTAALVSALKGKRLAGAGLDVFEGEPLEASSPLWDLPNVFLSSHVAGLVPNYDDLVTDLFVQNLKRYVAGEPLHRVVNKTLGY